MSEIQIAAANSRQSCVQFTFDNGWTCSVAWGVGNYCSNRGKDRAEIATTAECARWRGSGVAVVEGWLTADKVSEFMAETAAL